MGLRASRKQSHDGAVDRHGLVGLVLDGEGVGHTYPRKQETFIEYDGFLEVFSGHFVFFAVEVVGPHGEPTDRVRGVVLD